MLIVGIAMHAGIKQTFFLVESSILPHHLRSRLQSLFVQIEEEFTEVYAENVELRKTVATLTEKLSNGDGAQWALERNEHSHTNGSDMQKVSLTVK